MLIFKPKFPEQLKEKLNNEFPLPSEIAYKDDAFVIDIITRIRNNKESFSDLSISELMFSYHLTKFCTEEEFDKLKKVFIGRINSGLFEVGWIYCQNNPNNKRAVGLFCEVCKWMDKNKPEVFKHSLIGRTGLPWEDVYLRAFEIMRAEKTNLESFALKYNIISDTVFFQQLRLTYLSRCGKDELTANESLLAGLIATADIEFLRPAIKNFTAKFRHDEISQLINDALSYRLLSESNDETLGLSPNMLQRIRRVRYFSVLKDCVNKSSGKFNVYQSISGMIKNVELLMSGFFSIDFGSYIVIDNTDWKDYAYAYVPTVFRPLLDNWKERNYPDGYWPSMNETEITDSRSVILGIKKASVIKLLFSEFDILYTKDLLSITRY